jgi:YHS domain-containing protein
MKPIFQLSLATVAFAITACGNSQSEVKESPKDASISMSTDTSVTVTYDISLVMNKKDPTCGMPVTAGISDTAHYEKYVLGFCSKECKDEFLKNPKASLAAAEIKK